MNGIKYLLDTNFIIGLLKSTDEVMYVISHRKIQVSECAYSCITRMELLGYDGIDFGSAFLIQEKLNQMVRIEISPEIEDRVIQLRN